MSARIVRVEGWKFRAPPPPQPQEATPEPEPDRAHTLYWDPEDEARDIERDARLAQLAPGGTP